MGERAADDIDVHADYYFHHPDLSLCPHIYVCQWQEMLDVDDAPPLTSLGISYISC